MRTISNKTDIKFIILTILLFAGPFATTFLLDIPIIKANLARLIIVYLLIIAQFIAFSLLIIETIKKA